MRRWLKRIALFLSATATSVALAAGAAFFNASQSSPLTVDAETLTETRELLTVNGGNPTVTVAYQGSGGVAHNGLYVASTDGARYEGQMNGIFGADKEDTTLQFSFPGAFDAESAGSNRGHFVFHIVDAETDETVLDVGIWDTYCGVQTYVRYGEDRWATSTDNATTINSRYGNEVGYSLFGMDDCASSVLRFGWAGNSNFSVYAKALETGEEILIAQFDGTTELTDGSATIEEGKTFGLPMLNQKLQKGYKITFTGENWNAYLPTSLGYDPQTPNAVPVTPVLFEQINGTSLVGAQVETPSWYALFRQSMPLPVEIALNGEYEYYHYAQSGVEILGATFTKGTQSGEVTDISVRLGEGEFTPVSAGQVLHEVGEYTVQYAYEDVKITRLFEILPNPTINYAKTVSLQKGNATVATGSLDALTGRAGLLISPVDGKPYAGKVNGIFVGDAKVEYTFPGERTGTLSADQSNAGHFVFRIQSVSTPTEGFAIHILDTYGNGAWGTQVCVEYQNRYFSTASSNGTWDSRNTTAGGYGWFGADGENASYFELRWTGKKLGVYAWNHGAEREALIALFDGTVGDAFGMDGSVRADEEKRFGLPDVSESFKEGYTIAFEAQNSSFINTKTNLVEEIIVPVTPIRLELVGGAWLDAEEEVPPTWYVEDTSTPFVEEEKAEILSVKLLLTESLVLSVKTRVDEGYESPTMTFTYQPRLDRPATVMTALPCEHGGELFSFRFDGYTPQFMANVVRFTLSATKDGEKETLAEGQYSLQTYIDGVLAGDFDAETKAVVKSLQDYGIEARKTSAAGGGLPTLESSQMPERVVVGEEENKLSLPEGNKDAAVRFASARLVYGNNVGVGFGLILQGVEKEEILIKVSIAGRAYSLDGAKLTEERSGERTFYAFQFFAVQANEFDEEISVTAYGKESGELLSAGVLRYSVNSYFAGHQNDEERSDYALAKAVYLYGKAVEAYEAKNG